MPLVYGLAWFNDAVVVRRLGRRGQRREPLGFGLGEVVALVTSMVWLVVDQVAKKVADSAVDGAAKGARAVVRKVFRRRSAPVVVPPLTREQLGEVRQRVVETAAQRGLSEKRATTIADAVVVRDRPDPPARAATWPATRGAPSRSPPTTSTSWSRAPPRS